MTGLSRYILEALDIELLFCIFFSRSCVSCSKEKRAGLLLVAIPPSQGFVHVSKENVQKERHFLWGMDCI